MIFQFFQRILFFDLKHRKLCFLLVCNFCLVNGVLSQSEGLKEIEDFSFLGGNWQIKHVYDPVKDEPKIRHGSMKCTSELDGRYIKCVYSMKKPDGVTAITIGYFNFNSIYKKHEALWISSGWPIKVLMIGSWKTDDDKFILTTNAQFPIQDEVIEFVRGELILDTSESKPNSFIRKTFIRTSREKKDNWRYHTKEIATRIKN